MPGTPTGGRLARDKNRAKFGADFYQVIGSIGGRSSNTGGFAKNKELARTAGAIGGARGRRTKAKQKPSNESEAQKQEKARLKLEKGAEGLRNALRAKLIDYPTYIERLRALEAKYHG